MLNGNNYPTSYENKHLEYLNNEMKRSSNVTLNSKEIRSTTMHNTLWRVTL